MNITRKSIVSGKVRTIDLPITQDQVDQYNNEALIQRAFSNLTADQREFYLTGVTADEWDETFPEDLDIEVSDEPAF